MAVFLMHKWSKSLMNNSLFDAQRKKEELLKAQKEDEEILESTYKTLKGKNG